TKKVGHTGTLDPSVTGVLPICVGRATKISQFLTANEKEYLGEVTLGTATTTEDADGEVVDEKLVDRVITVEEIKQVFENMIGTNTQTPPMYSAVKVNGKKLYEYARAGIEVERPTREVTIFELELIGEPFVDETNQVRFRFRVRGSKGLYVRTVAVMIGEALGFPAHMSHLRRIASGVFTIPDCVTIEELKASVDNQTLKLMTIENALAEFPSITVDEKVERLVRNGVQLYPSQVSFMQEPQFMILSSAGDCLAIYEKHPSADLYKSVRGLF
ncbi:MAG: tRNA pseudouridine(55) synthase TruB, partial [Turicibacter sp.]